jgi:hypothetical protein
MLVHIDDLFILGIEYGIDPLYLELHLLLSTLVCALDGERKPLGAKVVISELWLHDFGPNAIVHQKQGRQLIGLIVSRVAI